MKKTLKALLAAIMVVALAATSFVVPVSAAKISENSVGTVFYPDNRKPSDDKRAVLILALFETKTGYTRSQGSGFIFGRNAVMTAAHVIYKKYKGGFAKKIYVLPENYEKDISFYIKDDGSCDLKVPKTAYTVKDFDYNSKIIGTSDKDHSWRWENDWAILETNGNIGDKYGYYEFSTGVSKSDTLTVTGFPGDKQKELSFSRWTESKEKAILDIDDQFIKHTVSTYKGSSGAATLVGDTAVGVLVADRDSDNLSTRITKSIYDKMLNYGRHFHVKYFREGGSGNDMADTLVWYGVDTTLRANTYKKTGYRFAGWTVKRQSDKKWLYQNFKDTSKKEWFFENQLPSSDWEKFKYNNQNHVAWTSPFNNDIVELHAAWDANTYTVKYFKEGGSGDDMADTKVTYGVDTTLRANTFKKTGYHFTGWTVKRQSDKKWLYQNSKDTSKKEWFFENQEPSSDWKKFKYNNQNHVARTSPFNNDIVELHAAWEANTYTVQYDPGKGGAGIMERTVIKFGTYTPLRKNTFLSIDSSHFAGWCAQKSSDKTWHYINPYNKSQDGWYLKGQQPFGWKKFLYFDEEKLAKTTSVDNDTITMVAQWIPSDVKNFDFWDEDGFAR